MIEISPLHHQLPEQQHQPLPSAASPTESKDQAREAEDTSTSHVGVTSVYSVPVPPGYATPSNVPLITPAYTTPVIIRHLSMDDDGKLDHSALKKSCVDFCSSVWDGFCSHRVESCCCALSFLFFKSLATRKWGLNLALPKDLSWLWGFSGFPKNSSNSRVQACVLAHWRLWLHCNFLTETRRLH